MSKAVSSMVEVLIDSDVSLPNADHAVWMPTRLHETLTVEYQKQRWPEFGIVVE